MSGTTGELSLTASGVGRADESFPLNEVRLTGRLAAIAEPHEMPSGDSVVMLRVVVPRAQRSRSSADHRGAGVDTIDVACWTPATQRAATRVGVEGWVEVTGALRRRFFRAGGAPASRYEVEASRLRRVRGPVADGQDARSGVRRSAQARGPRHAQGGGEQGGGEQGGGEQGGARASQRGESPGVGSGGGAESGSASGS